MTHTPSEFPEKPSFGSDNSESVRRPLKILGAKDCDSTGTVSWQDYLSSQNLTEAWAAPAGSPYSGYVNTTTLDGVNNLAQEIKPRYSEAEEKSRKELLALIANPLLDHKTAVVLDSGGSHSIAMAVELAEITGHQPVILFDEDPAAAGAGPQSIQETATALYYATEIEYIKKTGKITADSPPVFVMDCHRPEGRPVLPSATELRLNGIEKIIYLNEGDQSGRINEVYQSTDRLPRDLKDTVAEWTNEGLQMYYTGISPSRPDRDCHDMHPLPITRFDAATKIADLSSFYIAKL